MKRARETTETKAKFKSEAGFKAETLVARVRRWMLARRGRRVEGGGRAAALQRFSAD